MEQFYATQTKQPESGRSSSTMEMDLTYFINSANKRSRTIAAPAFNTSAISSWVLATGMMGSWNPELGMCRSAAPPINSFGATPITTTAVTRSSFSFINKNVPAALNTSALHKHSSALLSGAAAAAIEAAADLSRGAAAVKEKKKRARPSRRVPTTVVKADTSNFKAMVQHFTGIPTTPTTDESTLAPSASSYSPQSTISASSPSFSKTVVHPMLCKISNSPPAYPNSTPLAAAATTTCPSRLLPSSFPTY